tara:strand:- start:2660 stop:2929 length:270 start_codon:yes stop_codon:yes gene_type:complete
MGYGQAKQTVKVKRVGYPKKLARKQMLNGLVIRSYAKDKNFLTDAMVDALKKHSKNHTNRHMKSMVYKMEKMGMSFSKAHKATMVKYGK